MEVVSSDGESLLANTGGHGPSKECGWDRAFVLGWMCVGCMYSPTLDTEFISRCPGSVFRKTARLPMPSSGLTAQPNPQAFVEP